MSKDILVDAKRDIVVDLTAGKYHEIWNTHRYTFKLTFKPSGMYRMCYANQSLLLKL